MSCTAPAAQLARPAFEELYREFRPRIFGYVMAHLRDRAEAEDISGQVFLRAFQAYPRFEPRHANPAAWLFTIARHACLDHQRQTRMSERALSALHQSAELIDPASIAERRILSSALRQKMTRLPVRQREAIELYQVWGLSFREAGNRLRCSEDAAKMLYHRALKALRLMLELAA